MNQTTISKSDQSYGIRKHKDVFRYRVTVPNTLFESAGIEQGTELGVIAEVVNNNLAISYTTDTSESDLTVSASKHTSGELSIPSALGSAGNLSEHAITWELRENGTDFRLTGLTTKELPNETQSVFMEVSTLKHVEQEISQDDSEWNQEHFQLYLDVTAVDQLNWDTKLNVAIELVQIDGNISISFNPDTSNANEKSIKTVTTTGEYQRDRLVYIPNDIVRTLGLIDTQLSIRRSQDKTILYTTEL